MNRQVDGGVDVVIITTSSTARPSSSALNVTLHAKITALKKLYDVRYIHRRRIEACVCTCNTAVTCTLVRV